MFQPSFKYEFGPFIRNPLTITFTIASRMNITVMILDTRLIMKSLSASNWATGFSKVIAID